MHRCVQDGYENTTRAERGTFIITLYQTDWCGYCAQVRNKLAELGLDYTIVNVPASHSDRTVVRDVSGQTYVPVLVDGDVVLDDENDIVRYLEKTYPQKMVR